MKKLFKLVSIVMMVCLLTFGITSIGVFAATGENIVTFIQEIVEKHVYYVDDVEVSEEEFNSVQAQQPKIIENIIEHKLYTDTVYKINGITVTESEYNAYVGGNYDIVGTKIKITAGSLIGANAGSLGDYISFEYNNSGIVIGLKVKSSKVRGVIYDYSDSYLSFCTQDATGDYYYSATSYGVIYQDINNGMTFKSGSCTNNNFYVANIDGINAKDVTTGTTIFKFETSANTASIDFSNIFDSITIIVK